MARLYYEESKTDPKIKSGGKVGSDYLEKVAKLIPSEVIAGYLSIFGLIPLIGNSGVHPYAYWIVFMFCLVLTPIYLNTQATPDKPKRRHLIFSTIGFAIWAYVTTGNTLVPNYYEPAVASILLVMFSLVTGAIPLSK